MPERRSNSLIVHARKQDMETIRRLIEKLDIDLYGGQRVFIYFAENTKARDLATTLDAIYGRGDRGPAITGTQQAPPGAASISRLSGVLPEPAAVVHPPAAAPARSVALLPTAARPGGGPTRSPASPARAPRSRSSSVSSPTRSPTRSS